MEKKSGRYFNGYLRSIFFEVRNLLGPKNTVFRHLEFLRFMPREWLVNQECYLLMTSGFIIDLLRIKEHRIFYLENIFMFLGILHEKICFCK